MIRNYWKLSRATRPVLCPTSGCAISLIEVSRFQYFYEALLSFAWKPIPFGEHMQEWQASRRLELKAGRGIYFLGSIAGSSSTDVIST
jgi:hypothetical protein